jgi:hypothetical protein
MEARNMKSLEKWTFWSWNIRINKDETCGKEKKNGFNRLKKKII